MSSTHAIRVDAFGGPDVMQLQAIELPAPAAGELQLRQTAIGVNYIDVYDRTGLYPMPLPGGLGREAAGVVEALGEGVTGFAIGDRVAYVHGAPGAYAARRNVPAARVLALPASIGDEVAAAVLLKGLTAQYLLRRTHRVAAGEWILVHAAAGGVGLLLCQWGRALGAHVIGVVGNEAKAELARQHGAEHAIVRGAGPIAPRVRELSGEGVAVVYDAVGAATFLDSLDCLRPLGLMVTYGNASGPVPPISPLELSKRGSLFLTRPQLFTYIGKRADYEAMSAELFARIADGTLDVRIEHRVPLARAADAHRALESRATTGSTILLP